MKRYSEQEGTCFMFCHQLTNPNAAAFQIGTYLPSARAVCRCVYGRQYESW